MSILFAEIARDDAGLDFEIDAIFDASVDDHDAGRDGLDELGMHVLPDLDEDDTDEVAVATVTPVAVRLDNSAIKRRVELPKWLFDTAGDDANLVRQVVSCHRRVVALEILEADLAHRTGIPSAELLEFKLKQLKEVSVKVASSKLARNALTCDRNDPEWVGNVTGALAAARAEFDQLEAELAGRRDAARNAQQALEALRKAASQSRHGSEQRLGAVKFWSAQLVGRMRPVEDAALRGEIFAALAKAAKPLAQDTYVRAALTGQVPAAEQGRVTASLKRQARRHASK